jgi:hypothetical protein
MMSKITDRLNKVLSIVNSNNISNEAYKKFISVTPARSGNAKRKTTKSGNSIEANYAYAGVLDKGRHMTNRGMRGSEKAPKGMSEPTIEHIRDYIKQTLGITIK